MADTAFEAVTSRNAWYAGEGLTKYQAAMINSSGKFVKANGTRPFAGMVEYGCDAADEVATVVRGVYPGIAGADLTAGQYVKPGTGATAGMWIATVATDSVIGIALTAAVTGATASIQMLETPFTHPAA